MSAAAQFDGNTIGAVLLAAGAARRFGGENKLLADIGGKCLLVSVAEQIAGAGIRDIVVVTGRDAPAIKAVLGGFGVRFAHNDAWQSGMGSSIATGVRSLGHHLAGAFIVHGDMPFLTSSLLITLMRSFALGDGHRIVFPRTADVAQCNPVLWPSRFFEELSRLDGVSGGKELLKRHSSLGLPVRFSVPAMFIDIDTAEDLAAAVERRVRNGSPVDRKGATSH